MRHRKGELRRQVMQVVGTQRTHRLGVSCHNNKSQSNNHQFKSAINVLHVVLSIHMLVCTAKDLTLQLTHQIFKYSFIKLGKFWLHGWRIHGSTRL